LQQHMSLNKKHIQEAQIVTPAAAAVRAWTRKKCIKIGEHPPPHHQGIASFCFVSGVPIWGGRFFARKPAWWLCLLCVCLFLWRNWNVKWRSVRSNRV
jgi:hypothetical protein